MHIIELFIIATFEMIYIRKSNLLIIIKVFARFAQCGHHSQ